MGTGETIVVKKWSSGAARTLWGSMCQAARVMGRSRTIVSIGVDVAGEEGAIEIMNLSNGNNGILHPRHPSLDNLRRGQLHGSRSFKYEAHENDDNLKADLKS